MPLPSGEMPIPRNPVNTQTHVRCTHTHTFSNAPDPPGLSAPAATAALGCVEDSRPRLTSMCLFQVQQRRCQRPSASLNVAAACELIVVAAPIQNSDYHLFAG